LGLAGGDELATLELEPITLGVKRTEGADLTVFATDLAMVSVSVSSLAQDSSSDDDIVDDMDTTVVASVVEERSDVSEMADSVSRSCSES